MCVSRRVEPLSHGVECVICVLAAPHQFPQPVQNLTRETASTSRADLREERRTVPFKECGDLLCPFTQWAAIRSNFGRGHEQRQSFGSDPDLTSPDPCENRRCSG